MSAAALAAAPPGVQKQMLGEKLYPAIAKHQPELAGKITGMMLGMNNNELLILLESEQQLKNKVDEAMRTLNFQMTATTQGKGGAPGSMPGMLGKGMPPAGTQGNAKFL